MHLFSPTGSSVSEGYPYFIVPMHCKECLCKLLQTKHAWDCAASHLPDINTIHAPGTTSSKVGKTCTHILVLTSNNEQRVMYVLGCDKNRTVELIA
jgi:hypothetical protein